MKKTILAGRGRIRLSFWKVEAGGSGGERRKKKKRKEGRRGCGRELGIEPTKP